MIDSLSVTAPSRLHLGLINESGLYGRVDGGIGLAISSPRWSYVLTPASCVNVHGEIDPELADAASDVIRRLCSSLALPPLSMSVLEGVPSHIGLGSKTGLLMSLARSMYGLVGLATDTTQLGRVVGRGGTSGAGVNLCDEGGIVVDLGRSYPHAKESFLPSSATKCDPPGVLLRLKIDEYSVVHLRYADKGLSGKAETDLFRRSCPVPHADTVELVGSVFCQILPAVLEHNDVLLQRGLASIQRAGLKRVEWLAQADVTARFHEHFKKCDTGLALCLSSMGPTLFVLTRDIRSVLDPVESFDVAPRHLIVTEPTMAGQEAVAVEATGRGAGC